MFDSITKYLYSYQIAFQIKENSLSYAALAAHVNGPIDFQCQRSRFPMEMCSFYGDAYGNCTVDVSFSNFAHIFLTEKDELYLLILKAKGQRSRSWADINLSYKEYHPLCKPVI